MRILQKAQLLYGRHIQAYEASNPKPVNIMDDVQCAVLNGILDHGKEIASISTKSMAFAIRISIHEGMSLGQTYRSESYRSTISIAISAYQFTYEQDVLNSVSCPI